MHRSRLALAIGFLLLAAPVTPSARAETWVGGSGNWSATNPPSAAGWSTAVPDAAGAVAEKTSTTTATTTQDIALGVTVGTISQAGAASAVWTIAPTNGITLDQDGAGAGFATIQNVSTDAGSNNALVISAGALTLADDLHIVNSSESTRSATTGAIAIAATLGGAGNLTLQNNNATAASIILSGGINHTGSITNSGTGTGAVTLSGLVGTAVTGVTQDSATSTLTLSGANTFTTGVHIKRGTVEVSTSASGLGTGTLTLGETGSAAAATLVVNAGGVATNTGVKNAITVTSGTGTRSILNATSTSREVNGNITLNNTLVLRTTSTGNLTVTYQNAVIDDGAGSHGIVIDSSGTGAVLIRGANTFDGGIVVKSGHLSLLDKASAGGTGAVQLGDTTGSANVRLSGTAGGAITNAINVVYGNSGTRTIGNFGGSVGVSVNSTVTLGGVNASESVNLTLNPISTGAFTLAGSVVGFGDIIISNTSTGVSTISSSIDMVGSIVVANTNSRPTTISGSIGSNVTGLTQGAVLGGALTLSGNNTFSGETTLGAPATLIIGNANALQNSTLNKTNGTLSFATGITAATFGGLTGSSGIALANLSAAAVTLSVGNNGASNSYAGGLSGVGSFVKVGAGTQTLSGPSTYSGTTTVSDGTLLLNGTHTTAGQYAVASGGTLGGDGSITTADADILVNSGGKLSPNGTLTLATGTAGLDLSAATAGPAGSLVFDLVAPGTSDKIELTAGTLIIGSGNLNFDDFQFTLAGPLTEGTYTLIATGSAVNGTLGTALTGNLGAFHTGTIGTGDGTDIVLTVASVPEPASLALVTIAAAGALTRRRRTNEG